jgi:hypothetical protein
MERITLFVPDELKRKLDEHPDINWAEVARAGLKKRVEQLKKFEKLVSEGAI